MIAKLGKSVLFVEAGGATSAVRCLDGRQNNLNKCCAYIYSQQNLECTNTNTHTQTMYNNMYMHNLRSEWKSTLHHCAHISSSSESICYIQCTTDVCPELLHLSRNTFSETIQNLGISYTRLMLQVSR